jgi:hypothetical protein
MMMSEIGFHITNHCRSAGERISSYKIIIHLWINKIVKIYIIINRQKLAFKLLIIADQLGKEYHHIK